VATSAHEEGIDDEHRAYQDDRVRQYLRVNAKCASSSSRLGIRGAYHVAGIVAGMISNHLEPEDKTFARVVDLMVAHWSHDVFSRAEVETFARYGMADEYEQSRILSEFDRNSTPEEKNDLLNFLTESSLTIHERAHYQAEMEHSIALWNDAMAGRSINPADPSLPKLFTFPLQLGRLESRFTRPPKPREYVVDGLVPAGITGLVSGFGGSNKTRLLIQLCVCVAAGIPFFGMATTPGAAWIACGEDDQDEVDRRLGAIVHGLSLTPEQIQHLNDRLLVYSTVGEDIRLTGSRHGSIVSTGLSDRLIERCKEHAEQCGLPVRLVGFDHFGLVSGGEINSNEDATIYSQQAGRIVQATGATVLTLAHHRKSSASQDADQNAVLGASAIVNTARLVLQLNTMNATQAKAFGISGKDRRRFTKLSVEKANAIPTGDVCWIRSNYVAAFDTIALERADLNPTKPEAEAKLQAVKEAAWTLVQEHAGRYSISEFAKRYAGTLGLGWQKLRNSLLDLIDEGFLETRPPTDHEREAYRLNRQTKETLSTKKALPSSDYQPPKEEPFGPEI
jgi:RecA-family ATPase